MITISCCMIVKNEEKVLARCLDSIRTAMDEIIIVDTGSTDDTKEIAKTYTSNVYDFEWVDDFSAARNFSFSKSTMDYQLWLDADDVMAPEELKKLLELKATLDPTTDVVTMRYVTHYDSLGNPILSSTRERLLKREKGYVWNDPVHEYIALSGNIFYSGIEIQHRKLQENTDSSRNLKIYEYHESKDKQFSPRELYYFARELKDHKIFPKAAYYFEKFLEGGKGWFEDNIGACLGLATCYGALKDEHKVLPILLKSFHFDAPRADICSEIGYYYKRSNNLKTALVWFDIAANLKEPDTIGFILRDYWGYIPNVEACVCCYALGDYKKALEYNERAAHLKPTAPAVEHNRQVIQAKILELGL